MAMIYYILAHGGGNGSNGFAPSERSILNNLQTLTRYVLRELLPPFLYSLGLMCSFILFAQTMAQIVKMNVPIMAIGRVGVWLVPDVLSYALPMSFLLACLMGFGRLAEDNEILAIKACGVQVIRLAVPVNLIALGIALVLLALNVSAIPSARRQARWEAVRMASLYPAQVIPEGEFIQVFDGISLFVERKDPRQNRLLKVKVDRQDEEGNKIIIQAASAEIKGSVANNDLHIILSEGSIVEVTGKEGKQSVVRKMEFQTFDQALQLGEDVLNPRLNPRAAEMSFSELRKKISGYFSDPDEEIREYKRYHNFVCEYHERWSRPFAIFVFALVGIPLAIGGKTGGKAKSFAYSFLVFAVYYLLMLPTVTLGEKGHLPAMLALWIPNLVLMAAGVGLYLKISSE